MNGASRTRLYDIPDDPEGESIEDDEEEERNKSHDNEVSNEKVVSTVSVVVSQRGCTNLRILKCLI